MRGDVKRKNLSPLPWDGEAVWLASSPISAIPMLWASCIFLEPDAGCCRLYLLGFMFRCWFDALGS
jgi:hypothetical protein